MIIKDEFTIDVPVETVWEFIHDIPQISRCIPGVQEVEEIGPDTYRGRVKVKVGPLSAEFSGRVTVIERIVPEKLVASVEGEDKKLASFVKGTFTGRLVPVEAGTRMKYEVDAVVRGRLAQFGFTVVKGIAKKLTAEFAQRLSAALAE